MKEAFPGGSVVKNLSANEGDVRDSCSIPRSGRSPGEGNGSPLQYSCPANPTDEEAWQVTVHGVTKDLDMTEQLKSNNIHEKNPEKLNNSQKWPKPSI